jgi:hypothetical protein
MAALGMAEALRNKVLKPAQLPLPTRNVLLVAGGWKLEAEK